MYNRATSSRLLYTLFITQSLFSAAQIAIFTLVAIVAARLSGTESAAGLPSTTLTFSQALAAYPIATLMGRFGRRMGLALGYTLGALGAVAGLAAIVLGMFPLLLVSAALLGMGRASGDQSRFAAGEMFPEAERARMIGRIVFAGTVGAVVGPLLVAPSAQLMTTLGLHPDAGAWMIAFALCTLAAVIAFFLLRPDPMAVARTVPGVEGELESDESQLTGRPLGKLLMLPTVQLAILATLVSQTVMVVLMVMTPLHMDHQHHGRGSISLVISAHTLGMFGLSAVTGYVIDRFGRIPMLVAGALTLILSALLAPLSTNVYILSVALFLLGLGWNFGFVAGSSLLADALQGAERARVQGVNDALVFFVAGIGSLGAGSLFASGGYLAVSIAGLALTVVLLGLIYRLTRPQLAVKAASGLD